MLAFVSFLGSFGLYTRLNAEVSYTFTFCTMIIRENLFTSTSPTWSPDAIKPSVINELWIRYMTPPPLQKFCYAHSANVCELANYAILSTSTYERWMNYLKEIGMSFVSVVTNSGLAWLFTRKRRVTARMA
jgi:hypothetical protein